MLSNTEAPAYPPHPTGERDSAINPSANKHSPSLLKSHQDSQAHPYLISEASAGSCRYTKQSGSGLEQPGGRAFPTARQRALPCSPVSSLHVRQHRSLVLTWEFILLCALPLMIKANSKTSSEAKRTRAQPQNISHYKHT